MVSHAENVEYVGRSIALKIIHVAFDVCVCSLTEESCILHDGFIVIPEMMFNEVAKEKLC